ncbi:probable prolyl 4-hydroxylase 6 isoform X1 [Miscanthus floridulus]|uniref:probable prolyl 4-hydroxylase 6 isoform X1 n=1 Tax=Miscanthus floridulus TaxID=154761 RepID=UPI00345AF3AE
MDFCRHLRLAAVLALLLAGCASAASRGAGSFDPSRVVQLSWRPRAFLHKGFLSDAECDHLIVLANDKLEKSMVADNESGKSVQSEVRTSSGMFLEKKQDEVVTRIEERISVWTFLPPGTSKASIKLLKSISFLLIVNNLNSMLLACSENGESIQILHYQNGEKYEPHYDYFHDKNNQALGGHRIATVLMYLSNVEKGGETIFPNAEGKLLQPKDDTWSDCARNGYAVKPVKGDALLFFSLHPDATTDSESLHGSCPVIEGQKWSATKWIHVRSFDHPVKQPGSSDGCEDDNILCPQWAAVGECAKNPNYMVGTKEAPGFCRKSCKVCTE